MRLNTREWGTGPRTALLLHGIMADSGCWWQVGPALAERGFRVIAVDLPGHGGSPRCPDADMETFVSALLESVPAEPDLAIAHSMGAFILVEAVVRLRPRQVVYIDTPFGSSRAEFDPAQVTAAYLAARDRQMADYLKRHTSWDERDRLAEEQAAARFDVATAVSLLGSAAGKEYLPPETIGSLMVRPEPSRYVPPAAVEALDRQGFRVRSIPGADHRVWYGHHDEFMGILDEWI